MANIPTYGCTLLEAYVEFFVIFIIGKFRFLYIVISFPDLLPKM